MARIRAVFLLGLWVWAIGFVAPFIIMLAILTGNEEFIYRPVRFFVRLGVALVGVHVEVSGLENLNPAQTYLFTPNHQSVLEVALLMTYLGRNPAYLAKKELFKFPVFGPGMRVIKIVPVDRRDRQAAIKAARAVAANLQKGKSYVVHPEGTRSPDGRLLQFKKGAFLMAIEAGVPVVPVTISGSGALMPKNKIKLYPGTVRITIHKPIEVHGYSKENIAQLMEMTRSAISSSLVEAQGYGQAKSGAAIEAGSNSS
jgi:1-acyl-sn-glycerol-3-phosphate acyltransferase